MVQNFLSSIHLQMVHLLQEVLNLDVKWIQTIQRQSIEIDQLGYTAELDRRVETVNSVIASTTSTKSVTFAQSFYRI